MQIIKLFFSFQGRISRQRFWVGSLGTLGFLLVFSTIAAALNDGADGHSSYDFILVIAMLPYIWANLAIQVKRWHDRGHSGWWVLVNAIPFIGWIWALVELGFLKGTTGENKYGDDPLFSCGSVLPQAVQDIPTQHAEISTSSLSSQDVQRQLGEFSGKEKTSNVKLSLVLAVAFIAIIGIPAAIAIPAYSSYTIKAKAVEGIALGTSASQAVDAYYLDTGKIPTTLKEAGFTTTTGKYVSNVTINPGNAEIFVTFGSSGSSQLDGKKLKMTPSKNTDKTISWKCSSDEIAANNLPPSCK